jgi:hypothetical protein
VTTVGFQTPQLKLADLLEDVRAGEIQLPDFQRPYKWDDDRIRELLVTVLRGHPMGALMLLDTGAEHVRFKPQPLARVAVDAEEDGHRALSAPSHLLLDGQQRMTSLYQALTGSGVVATKDSRGKELSRRYFLDVERALGSPTDQNDAVRSLPHDGVVRENFDRDVVLDVSTRERQVAEGLMPFTSIFDGSATKWLLEYTRTGDDRDARLDIFERFNEDIVNLVKSYVIPAIQLDDQTTKEAVATVFEKVNSGGLPLNNFELLTAIYAGDAEYYAQHGDDFRLGEDWAQHQRAFAQHPVLAGTKPTDFLQAVLLLASRRRRLDDIAAGRSKPRPITARGEDILGLSLDEYLEWAPRVRNGFLWAAGFYLGEHIHTEYFVPYRTQTVPLAVLRVLLGEDVDVYTVRDRIRRWFWCGVLGELYGSTTESRFASDAAQVPDWALAGRTGAEVETPKTVVDAYFQESRLLSLRTGRSAAYKGIYALLMARGARDWKLDQAIDHAFYLDQQIDIHHVFPHAWCIRNDIDPNLRDCIVNKTPLAKKTNISLRGDSPAVYVPRLLKDTGMEVARLDGLVASHLIDPAALRAGDFEAYFSARREALVSLVAEAIGKPVARDVVADSRGQLYGGEDASAFEDDVDETADDTDLEGAL